MRPRRFPAANKVFELPGGTEDNFLWVQLLEVTDEVLGDRWASKSVHEFTPEERVQIAAGANVALYVVGSQPPIHLEVTDEPLGRPEDPE